MKAISEKFPGTKILVADDYPINLELLINMLEIMDCEVATATDGKEALEMFKNNKYEFIFMDVQMPELDGYKTTEEIRKLENDDEHIPIIAITANAMTGDKEKCLASGMDDYVSKPIKGADLVQMLKKHLKNK